MPIAVRLTQLQHAVLVICAAVLSHAWLGCCTDEPVPKPPCDQRNKVLGGCSRAVLAPHPKVLAKGQAQAQALAVDESYVYFNRWYTPDDGSSEQQLARVPKGGGDVERLAAVEWVTCLASAGPWLVVGANRGQVLRVPKSGGASLVIDDASKRSSAGWASSPVGLVIEGPDLYWAIGQELVTAPVAGGEPRVIARGKRGIAYVAVDGSHVYASDVDGVWRVPKGGGAVQVLAHGGPGPIAVQGGELYWAWDALLRLNASDGGGRVWVAPLSEPANRVVLGPKSAYWAERHGVMAAPRAGGEPTLVADIAWRQTDGPKISDIAVYGSELYFISYVGDISSVAVR